MKIIFLSNIVLPKTIKKYKSISTISVADNNAQLSLINSLSKYYGKDFITITPAYNNNLTFKHIDENIEKYKSTLIIKYKNNSNNKIIYYFDLIRGYYKELKKLLKTYKGEKIIVITNGPHLFRALAPVLLKKKYKFKFVPFFLGGVELPEMTGIFKLISSFSPKLARKADASITYVDKNSLDYTNNDFVEILFTLNKDEIKLSNKIFIKNKKESKEKTVLFSGALNNINGMNELIEIIKKVKKNYKFLIAGDGDYKDRLIELEDNYNIKYLGKISHDECIKLQHSVDYLIMLRNRKDKFGEYHSKYSISSKIFEYLLSGTPVITNNHEALQKELRQFVNIISNYDVDEIVNFLNKNIKISKEIKEKAIKGRNYVIENANEEKQGIKLHKFIEKISKED